MTVFTMGRKKILRNRGSKNNHKIDTNDIDNKLEKTSKRKPSRPTTNAARERSRVQNLKSAFLELQGVLPNVPDGTKLSKLDVLLLATNYISHLMSKLYDNHLEYHLSRLQSQEALHPIKKWPMRSRLYVSDPSHGNTTAAENEESAIISHDRSSISSSSSGSISDQSTPVFDSSDSSVLEHLQTDQLSKLSTSSSEIVNGSPIWNDVFSDAGSSVD